jgi:hypothetical protein
MIMAFSFSGELNLHSSECYSSDHLPELLSTTNYYECDAGSVQNLQSYGVTMLNGKQSTNTNAVSKF